MHCILQSIKNNIIPFEEEKLTDVERLNEYIMTSLRTIEGLDLKIVENNFSIKERKRIEDTVVDYINKKMIVYNNEKLLLTNEGKLFADGIAADLFVSYYIDALRIEKVLKILLELLQIHELHAIFTSPRCY